MATIWSEVQPAQRSTYSILQFASLVDPVAPALDAAFEGSEGGDTWSSLQAVQESSGRDVAQSRPARPDSEYISLAGGSEGGDTWSHFVPRLEGQPIAAPSLASGAPFERR